MMPEVILTPTIPGTGTYFLGTLLQEHPQIIHVGIDGEAPIYPLIGFLLTGIINEERFNELIEYVAGIQEGNDNPVRMTVFRMLHGLPAGPDGVPLLKSLLGSRTCIALGSHLYPPRLDSKFWLTDLMECGYRAKRIIPLRDPALVISSLIIKGARSVAATEHGLALDMYGFRYLAAHADEMPTFFLPLDLYGQSLRVDERVERIGRGLFEQFLGLSYDEVRHSELHKFIVQWPRVHPIDQAIHPMQPKGAQDIIRKAVRIKEQVAAGADPTGILDVVDRQIEILSELGGLKRLYQELGYSNLCWF